MVTTIISLKTRMLINGILREKWKLVIHILVGMYLIPFSVFMVWAMTFGLEDQAQVHTALMVQSVISALFPIIWVLLPMAGYGVDDSLDPRRFAPFVSPSTTFAHSLVSAAIVGPGGLITFFLLLLPALTSLSHGLIVTGVLYCLTAIFATYLYVLLGRWSATTLGYRLNASRGSKDRTALISSVVFLLVFVPFGLWVQYLGNTISSGGIATAFDVLKWTPLVCPTAFPLLVNNQDWLAALVQLLYLGTSLFLLLRVWTRGITPAMVGLPRPLSPQAEAAIAAGRWVVDEQLAQQQQSANASASHHDIGNELMLLNLWGKLGAGPATSAIAARTLHDWIKDPRLSSSIIGVLVLPVLAVAMAFYMPQSAGISGSFMFYLATLLLGMTIGLLVSYDSTAFWIHVSSPVTGWQDRVGRILGSLPVALLCLLIVAAGANWVDPSRALLQYFFDYMASFLIAVGLTSAFTGRFTIGAQPPGANPLSSKGTGNQLITLLVMMAVWAISAVLLLPLLLVSQLYATTATASWIASVGGVIWGSIICIGGVAIGAKVYDRGSVKLLALIRSWPGH